MKICTITYAHSPSNIGGADLYAEKISKQLSKRGHDVFSISARPTFEKSLSYSLEANGNYRVYWFYPLNISTFHNVAKKSALVQGIWRILDLWNIHSYYVIKKILKKEKPDIVHIHTPVGLSPSVFKAVKSLGIPLVFTLHDYYLICPRIGLLHASGEICTKPKTLCKIYSKINKKLVGDALDVVIAPSKFVMDMHVDNGLFNKSEKIILPHGIENNIINLIIDSHAKRNCIDLLYVGSLAKHKGVHILIEAFKQVPQKDMRLNIVGRGIYDKELKKLAKGDERIFFHGRVSDEELGNYYKQADFLVMPSIWHETFGLVVLESFSYGTPVIGSKIGAIPELIKDGYNGYLFKPSDSNQLKIILSNLDINSECYLNMRKDAYKSVEDYNIVVHIEEMENIYNHQL